MGRTGRMGLLVEQGRGGAAETLSNKSSHGRSASTLAAPTPPL